MEKKISSLDVQKNNPNRLNVFLDGEYAFSLARIVAAWLEVGTSLSTEKIGTLQAADMVETAYQKSLKYISYRPRTTNEVRKRLENSSIPPDTINIVIEQLSEKNLLDDHQFAEFWVENRLAFRPKSRRALRQELRQKGVEDEIIENVIQEIKSEDDIALNAGLKYLHRMEPMDRYLFKQRMGGYLARKGFTLETIGNVLPALWESFSAELNHIATR